MCDHDRVHETNVFIAFYCDLKIPMKLHFKWEGENTLSATKIFDLVLFYGILWYTLTLTLIWPLHVMMHAHKHVSHSKLAILQWRSESRDVGNSANRQHEIIIKSKGTVKKQRNKVCSSITGSETACRLQQINAEICWMMTENSRNWKLRVFATIKLHTLLRSWHRASFAIVRLQSLRLFVSLVFLP